MGILSTGSISEAQARKANRLARSSEPPGGTREVARYTGYSMRQVQRWFSEQPDGGKKGVGDLVPPIAIGVPLDDLSEGMAKRVELAISLLDRSEIGELTHTPTVDDVEGFDADYENEIFDWGRDPKTGKMLSPLTRAIDRAHQYRTKAKGTDVYIRHQWTRIQLVRQIDGSYQLLIRYRSGVSPTAKMRAEMRRQMKGELV